MDGDKIVGTGKQRFALLAGFFLCAFVLIAFHSSGFADDDDGVANAESVSVDAVNLLALHDSGSRQYGRRCLDCHADVLTQQSLDPWIPAVHVAMVPHVPGETVEEGCAWCHRSVDLVEKSTGNLRKHVSAALCALCHGPSGPAARFYQSGPSPTQPDGPALYELVCAACHGDLANSEVRGESADEIRGEIADNEGGMGPLSVLSAAEIQAIADALAGPDGSGGGD